MAASHINSSFGETVKREVKGGRGGGREDKKGTSHWQSVSIASVPKGPGTPLCSALQHTHSSFHNKATTGLLLEDMGKFQNIMSCWEGYQGLFSFLCLSQRPLQVQSCLIYLPLSGGCSVPLK
jgi:hypothetical protein